MLQQSLPDSQQHEVEGSVARFLATWLVEGKREGWVSHSTSVVRSCALRAFTCFCEKI